MFIQPIAALAIQLLSQCLLDVLLYDHHFHFSQGTGKDFLRDGKSESNNPSHPFLAFHQPSRASHSVVQHQLEVLQPRYIERGDCDFALAGPKLWNALPLELCSLTDLNRFKAKLKTHLFTGATGSQQTRNIHQCCFSVFYTYFIFCLCNYALLSSVSLPC